MQIQLIPRPIANTNGFDISPDGQILAFGSQDSANQNLYTYYNVNYSAPTQTTQTVTIDTSSTQASLGAVD